MTIKELLEKTDIFTVVNEGDFDREIKGVYCCDLLSIVMGRLPADYSWVTVMGNVNACAVATLADASCVILAEDICGDGVFLNKAQTQGINVLASKLPVFDTAKLLDAAINA